MPDFGFLGAAAGFLKLLPKTPHDASNRRFPVVILVGMEVRGVVQRAVPLPITDSPLPGCLREAPRERAGGMNGRSDIEHLQALMLQLSPENAELINRLERARLILEFMLAGTRRPTSREAHAGDRGAASSVYHR